MTNRLSIRMTDPVQARKALDGVIWMHIKANLVAGNRMTVEVKPETRSSEQNARLWAMLTEVSEQVDWYGKKLSPSDWKHVFSASLRKLDVVPNLDGTGFVALGLSTSQMTRKEMAEMQELIEAFGAEKGVRFSAVEHA